MQSSPFQVFHMYDDSVNRDLGPTCLRTESNEESGRLLFMGKIRESKLLRLFWMRPIRHGPEWVSTLADVAVRSS